MSQAWRFDAPGDFVEAMLAGAVRAKALLEAQDPRALATIRQEVAHGTARYARADGAYHLPMPALVGSGSKPAPRSP